MTAERRRELPDLPPLDCFEDVHVIGICGTAMGTLAAMLRERGLRVRGSDAMAYPPMSTWLEARGLEIQSGYRAEHIAPETDLVVVGNVSRRDNPEAVATIERGLPFISLPEALRLFFFGGRRVLVPTGTHGKTTTSAMAAWILHEAGHDPSFFIGGVTINFGSNYRLGDGRSFVVEGDEYDTAYFDKVPKFWHYPALAATINNVELDHADIYPDLASIERVFTRFAAQVDPAGALWVNGDDPVAVACADASEAPVRTFGLDGEHDYLARLVGTSEEGTRLVVRGPDGGAFDALLPTIGAYNVRNFLGAAGLVESVGVSLAEAASAMRTFRGVQKRQELKGVVDDIVVIDDFAHHPTAVANTLRALRARHPDRRMWAIFEAKSNTSRRAVFQDDYPPAFDPAEIVVLSQPWKKDDLPEAERISIPKMVDAVAVSGKEVHLIPDVGEIVAFVASRARPGDVVVGLSGSSFGGLHDRLLEALRDR